MNKYYRDDGSEVDIADLTRDELLIAVRQLQGDLRIVRSHKEML